MKTNDCLRVHNPRAMHNEIFSPQNVGLNVQPRHFPVEKRLGATKPPIFFGLTVTLEKDYCPAVNLAVDVEDNRLSCLPSGETGARSC